MTSALPLNHLEWRKRAESARVLAQAFCDVPTSLAIYRGMAPAERLRCLERVFRVRVAACCRRGDASVILEGGRIVAAALYFPFQAFPLTRVTRWRERVATGLAGKGAVERSTRLDEFQRRRHPTDPHWYLYFTGVAPEFQGRGYGLKLLERASALADHDGVFCYLETDRKSLAELYERRLGYEVVYQGPVAGLEGQLENWLMIRRLGG